MLKFVCFKCRIPCFCLYKVSTTNIFRNYIFVIAIFGNFHMFIIEDSKKSSSFFESSVIPNCACSILKSVWFRNIQSIVKLLICICLLTILVYVSMQSSELFIPITWNPWWGSQAGWGRWGSISRSSYCPFWENCFALVVADWVIQALFGDILVKIKNMIVVMLLKCSVEWSYVSKLQQLSGIIVAWWMC